MRLTTAVLLGGMTCFLSSVATSARGDVVFADTTFNDANWLSTTILVGNGGVVTGGQSSSGGNPGSYRRYTHEVSAPTPSQYSALCVFHMQGDATYDPAKQGAITSIAYSEDVFAEQLDPSRDGSIGAGLAAMQDGVLFLADYRIDSGLSWLTHTSRALTASDFLDFDTFAHLSDRALHLDFSSSASPIVFGFYRANSQDAGFSYGYSVTGGTDNWRVTVTPVPAPGASLLAITGLGLLGALKRRVAA